MIKGYKFSEEQKRKRYSPEILVKISSSMKGHKSWNKGIPMSEEAKIKLSKSIKGRKMSVEFKEKCSKRMKGVAFFKGKKHSAG